MSHRGWDDLPDLDFNDDIGQPKLFWEGSTVEVRARVVPRYFWTTASIDVFLDGRCILKTGGQMKSVGSSTDEFQHGGVVHTAALSWGNAHMRHALGLTFPYQLFFDGSKIAVSEVSMENPASVYIPLLIIVVPILLPLVASIF